MPSRFRWFGLQSVATLGFAMLLLVVPAWAQEEGADEAADANVATDEQNIMDQVDDIIVVTASRIEQPLHEVPAAMTVLTAEDLEKIPADDYGDFLRNVPGLNVSQMSARDIQITGRAATSSLAAQELVLLDNRTLYLDFFGFVMWDFVPLDVKEIKQIEVVRGPGSAVWGANAMSGVINLITKRPREMQGTSLTLGGGDFSTLYASITHAGVSNSGNVGYKLSGSYYEQDPYERPSGIIPGTVGPANPAGTSYPDFRNQGTEQPKFNFRVDFDKTPSSTYIFSGGTAGTEGIIHSGIGPFDISSGTEMTYAKFDWNKNAARMTLFTNLLDGDALNLLAIGPDGQPLNFAFQSETYNLDYSNTKVVGEKNIFTFGGTARHNEFDLSIAPAGDSRDEFGVYLQDEILLGDKARWLIGVRWDDIDPIGSVVSPRTSLLFGPGPNHTFRISFNRAFRVPSMINNFLDVTILNAALLPPVPPFSSTPFLLIFPFQAVGNPEMQEERLDAIEVGYVGTFGNGTTFTLSVYRNETTDSADFFTAANYDGSNPVPGWPFPAFLLDPPFPFAGVFPSAFSYRNIGEIIDEGVELSLDLRPADNWSVNFNASHQSEPEISGIDLVTLPNGTQRFAVNTPAENRANLTVAFDNSNFFFNSNVNFVDDAFWTDVLDSRFWGPTESFTQLNLGAGVRFQGDKVTLSVTGQNVLEEDVLQHIFGDLIDRKITAQLVFRF